jgi:hypothetical protein
MFEDKGMFSIKNAAYVAIMQLGVIVAGVLAAGLWWKVPNETTLLLPIQTAMLANHTLIFLSIPLVWIIFTMLVASRPEVSDDVKNLAFWSGVLLLIGLVIFVIYADTAPLFRGIWMMTGDDN